ncbi:MAG: glycosyltransferase family 39 protein, partial [Abditibacteriales bacterium]|nr:glycosyltransferase family 39 protein [Abditibacteriales bacterium]
HKPPLALVVFACAFALFGKTMAAVNALALLWAVVTTLLVFLLTQRLFGRSAAIGAALFYAVFANSDTVNGTSPSYDFWMLPFMVAAVYCFVRGSMSHVDRLAGSTFQRSNLPTCQRSNWLLVCGVCSGLAVTSKQHALFNFVALLNFLALRACVDSAQRKRLFKDLLLLGAGFALAWLPFVFYFWSQGALPAFLDSLSPRHNISYMGTRTAFDAWFAARTQFVRQISRDTILWIFALVGLMHLLVGRNRAIGRLGSSDKSISPLPHFPVSLLLWLWAFWSLVGVSITKRFYDHYFQQIIPVFSVLAGYVWGVCFEGLGVRGPGSVRRSATRSALRWALATIVVLGFLWSGRQSFRAREMLRRTHALLTGQHEPTVLEQVGDYLRAHSTPEDRIYVWGWKPEIYYFADRRAPTKWWEFGIETGRWRQIQPEFERHKPKFIVVNGTLGGPPEFQDYVQRNYALDRQIAQFQILRRRAFSG